MCVCVCVCVWKALGAGRYVLCFATGLGKTLSAYCVYFYWMLRGGFRGKLLVLTNKTAVLQFGGELGKFFDSDIRCVCVHEGMGLEFEGVRYKGYKGVRGAVWDSFGKVGGVDVVVMNHELFGLEGGELIARVVGLKAAGVRVMLLVLTNKTAVLQFGGELGKFFDSDIRCVCWCVC